MNTEDTLEDDMWEDCDVGVSVVGEENLCRFVGISMGTSSSSPLFSEVSSKETLRLYVGVLEGVTTSWSCARARVTTAFAVTPEGDDVGSPVAPPALF